MSGITRARPRQLGYAEITANVTGISTQADIPGLALPTFIATSLPVLVEFWLPQWRQNTTTGIPTMSLFEGSTAYGWTTMTSTTATTVAPAVFFKQRITTLTPGTSYTFKCRGQTSAGTFDWRAGTGANALAPSFIRAYEEG